MNLDNITFTEIIPPCKAFLRAIFSKPELLFTCLGAYLAARFAIRNYFVQRKRELKEQAYLRYALAFSRLAALANDDGKDKKQAQIEYFSAEHQVKLVGSKQVVSALPEVEELIKNLSSVTRLYKAMRSDLGQKTPKKYEVTAHTTSPEIRDNLSDLNE